MSYEFQRKVGDYSPDFADSIKVDSYKMSDSVSDLAQKLVGQNQVMAFWIIIVLTIIVIWFMWKQSKNAEGFTGAGSAYISGNAQDQPYFQGSERGKAMKGAYGVPFPSMEGFRGMGMANSYVVRNEGFSPSMIQKDAQGNYFFVDNDNKAYGNIYFDGVPLDAQGNVLSSLLVDDMGRAYYYSSNQVKSFRYVAETGKFERVPAILGGAEPAPSYVLVPGSPVDISSLGNSLTQSQLTGLMQDLGCSAEGGASDADPWGWLRQQQKASLGIEGMKNGDAKLINAMLGN